VIWRKGEPLKVDGFSAGTFALYVMRSTVPNPSVKHSFMVIVGVAPAGQKTTIDVDFEQAWQVTAHWKDQSRAAGARLAYLRSLTAAQ
jgi:hypothetical protein